MKNKRFSVLDIKNKKNKEPIICLTSYTAPLTRILDQYTDLLLVGDTVGMVLYGMDSTLSVTLDMMINHGKAVVKASKRSCIIVDMPFATYQKSPEQAFENAAKIISETGCNAVKLEGGIEMVDTIKFLTQRGIPVMGHIGLTPQHVNKFGGYKFQGKQKEQQAAILNDAKAIEDSGAFSIVLECIPEQLATTITHSLEIPTIGIGASNKCDGQILVSDDMLGNFSDFTPKFVKKYGKIDEYINKSVEKYAKDVKQKSFPSKEFTYQ